MNTTRNDKRKHRTRRIRARISGTKERPRVSIFRSLTSFRAQVIDDATGTTIASANLADLSNEKNTVEGAAKVGAILVKKCKDIGIESAVFDRSGYKYHGKVKAFADALRDGGLKL